MFRKCLAVLAFIAAGSAYASPVTLEITGTPSLVYDYNAQAYVANAAPKTLSITFDQASPWPIYSNTSSLWSYLSLTGCQVVLNNVCGGNADLGQKFLSQNGPNGTMTPFPGSMAYTFNEFAKIREGGVDTLRLNVYEQQFNYNHLERPSIYTSLYSQVTFEFNFQLGTLDLSNKSLPDFSLVTSSKATYTDIDYFCTYDDYAMCVPWASSYTQDSTNFTILNGSLRVLGAAVPVSIPEPASFALMGVGLVALRMRRVFARQR